MEIQIDKGDGMGNQTIDLQITSPTSKKVRHSNHSAKEDATRGRDWGEEAGPRVETNRVAVGQEAVRAGDRVDKL